MRQYTISEVVVKLKYQEMEPATQPSAVGHLV